MILYLLRNVWIKCFTLNNCEKYESTYFCIQENDTRYDTRRIRKIYRSTNAGILYFIFVTGWQVATHCLLSSHTYYKWGICLNACHVHKFTGEILFNPFNVTDVMNPKSILVGVLFRGDYVFAINEIKSTRRMCLRYGDYRTVQKYIQRFCFKIKI